MALRNYDDILGKLGEFHRKYYTRMLLAGLLIFLALGAVILFAVLSVEYFFWLPSGGRLVLLVTAILLEGFLLVRYIVRPLVFLLRFREGLSNKQASLIIGRHFPDVGDKLYNLLDLAEDKNTSDLLLASIAQRSNQLYTVPFSRAVDYRSALSKSKYLLVPIVILLALWITDASADFWGSYKRVIDYQTAYEPPAPFEFEVLMGDLDALENEPFTVQVKTKGSVKPESIYLVMSGRQVLMKEEGGISYYTFEPPLEPTSFQFFANGVRSRVYEIRPLKVPALEDFSMKIEYPAYLKRPGETIKSTGNAVLPEGSRVQWTITGRNTDTVKWATRDTVVAFYSGQHGFTLSQRIYNTVSYEILTSNENVSDHERLAYQFSVVKDAYPKIKAREVRDSLNPDITYYLGEASDDYGVQRVELVAYPRGKEGDIQRLELVKPASNVANFYYTFPSGLDLAVGETYEYYFEVRDNDGLRNGKAARTGVFFTRILNEDEIRERRMESQQGIIRGMDKVLDEFKEEGSQLQEISNTQKQKGQLNFNEQSKIRNFLQKQKQQEEMMQKFSKELKDNLEEGERDDPVNKLLQERLERQEMEAEKNARLLDELRKIADKLDKEELAKRLEEIGKQRQSNERSLEQLLELTRRYYVTEKAGELSRELERQAKEQLQLSERGKGDSMLREQERLNEEFMQSSRELDSLRKSNNQLKKPLSLDVNKRDEESVQSDQRSALEELNKKDNESRSPEKAGQKQKSAAGKLQQMSEKLRQSTSEAGGESGIAEDAAMLRQILDNLITFSFKQERLFEHMEKEGDELANFSSRINEQQELRGLFEHVDDSLFALSLRRVEIAELVNEQITEVFYNIDKALESIAEGRLYQGVSHQQYVFTAANTLADLLAGILDNMQESLSMGKGSGSNSQGFQLPDIIKAQGELQQKMGEMGGSGKQGQQGQSGEGESPGQTGSDGRQGEGDGQGQQGESGEDGQNGNAGNDGSGVNGNNGSNGSDGNEGMGPGEDELREVYEIYKEQQIIRDQLEQQLQDMMGEKDRRLAQLLIKQMEEFENQLLRSGITTQTINKMNFIQHELLKLENAALKQGEQRERESTTNKARFTNPITTKPTALENYGDEIEILTRQALPLQQIYRDKVKNYFREDD